MPVILFSNQNPNVRVVISANFDHEDLVIEGYEIGDRIEELWGDSDLEYSTRIKENELSKLYDLFHLAKNDKNGLLRELQKRFHANTCYSDMVQFLKENNIPISPSLWI